MTNQNFAYQALDLRSVSTTSSVTPAKPVPAPLVKTLQVDIKDLPSVSRGLRDLDQQKRTNLRPNMLPKPCRTLGELSDSDGKIPLKPVRYRETSLTSTLRVKTTGEADIYDNSAHNPIEPAATITSTSRPIYEASALDGFETETTGPLPVNSINPYS